MKLDIQRFADGKVVIDTDLNEKGFSKGLTKMKGIASTGFKAIAVSTGVAAGAIATLVGKSVGMAGELEQQIGGTEAVFKNFAKTVQEKAVGAFEKMGVSANDYMATANKMGSLMQGAGLDIETSMDLSSKAMQRAADVASIMGISTDAAMESIAGAAKGNFTMMDNLGVAMNATTIEAYAMSKGMNQSYNEMDNATKVGLAMQMFLEKTAYAEGNYAKENKTFAGSFSTLKAATSNFLSGAGGIQDVAKALIGFSEILVKSIGEMAPTIVTGLIQLLDTIMPQIPILLNTLLPIIIQGAIDLINGLIVIFPALIQLIQTNLPTIIEGAVMIVKTLVTTVLSMLPTILEMGIVLLAELIKGIATALPQLIPAMVDAVMLMVETLVDNLDLIISAGIQLIIALTLGLIEALPRLIEKIPTIIDKIVQTLTDPKMIEKLLYTSFKLMVALGVGLIKAIPELLKAIPKIIKSLLDGFNNIASSMWNIGKNVVSGIWQGISNGLGWIKSKIKGWVGDVVDFIKRLFGIHSPSTVMRDQVGKYLAQGLGVGFDKELDNVYDKMQNAVDIETNKMSANVKTSGTYQMAMTGTPQFNLLDRSNNTTTLKVNGKVLAEVVNTENRNREVAKA